MNLADIGRVLISLAPLGQQTYYVDFPVPPATGGRRGLASPPRCGTRGGADDSDKRPPGYNLSLISELD